MTSEPHKTKALGAGNARNQPDAYSAGGYHKSLVEKRSLVIGRHKTSVSLEDQFWNAIREIARDRKMTLSQLVAGIDGEREHNNLSSAIRLFVIEHFRSR